ncbi:MAG: hypothetical protein K2J70_05185 [Muribaculaceae bacterium]|nr:hypothetical protein [Muribaculaceae bacterium]
MENEERKRDNERKDAYLDQVANGLRADAKMKKNEGTRKSNKLWLWLGILILIFILLYWIFGIGTQEAIDGIDNGVQTEVATDAGI